MKNLQALGSLANLGNPSGSGSPLYSLYDKFTTALSAGSVNATNAEPTGGARSVTDTNSKISIASNVLTFITGEAATDGIWYTSLARLAGKTVLTQIIASETTNGIPSFGWDSNSSGAINDAINFAASGVLQIVPNGGTAIAVGIYTATTYNIAAVMRGTGIYWFIKGGAFINWTYLWSTAAGTAAGIPSIGAGNTTAVFTADNIRVPQAIFLPIPAAYDTFTRSNGALGSTEASGPDSQVIGALSWTGTIFTVSSNAAIATPNLGSELIVNGGFGADTDWNKGANWSISGGVATGATASSSLTQTVAPLTVQTWYLVVFTITARTSGSIRSSIGTRQSAARSATGTFQQVYWADTTAFSMVGSSFVGSIDNVSCKALTLSELFASISTSTQDVVADVNITLPSPTDNRPAGLVINLDSAANPQNFVIADLDGQGNAQLQKCVAGTYSVLIGASVAYSAGATLRVIKDGTSYQLFYNNVQVGTTTTISDAGIISNTLHGIFSTASGNTLDNFTLFPRGTNNEYGTLDRF